VNDDNALKGEIPTSRNLRVSLKNYLGDQWRAHGPLSCVAEDGYEEGIHFIPADPESG
jgi:hypothetical protein